MYESNDITNEIAFPNNLPLHLLWILTYICVLCSYIVSSCTIHVTFDEMQYLLQAIAETQLLRVTSMSTAVLMVYIDCVKNLPVT